MDHAPAPSEPGPALVSDGASVEPPWGAALVALPFWRSVLAAVGAGLLLVALCRAAGTSETWRQLAMMSTMYIVPLCWWLAAARRRGCSPRMLLGTPPSWGVARLAVLAALAAFTVHIGWLAIIAALDLAPESWKEPIVKTSGHGQEVAWALIAIVLDPPVEELAFRGVLYQRLLRWVRPVWAALGTSVLFGLLHPDPVGIGLLGLVLMALTRQTRSLWAPIIAHACNNALGVVLSHVELPSGDGGLWLVVGAQLVCVPWLARLLWHGLRDGSPRVTRVASAHD